MHVNRDAAPVIAHRDGAIGVERDINQVAMAGEGFVNGVIHDLVDHVMQAGPVIGVADIHARALAHRI